MISNNYEVIYVDKFTDSDQAESTKINLQRTFHLGMQHIEALSCGKPVIIKKGIGLEEAKRYKRAIANAGGIAWIQELDEEGNHQERRSDQRRLFYDRRAIYRASSILPDRRRNYGRRSSDSDILH